MGGSAWQATAVLVQLTKMLAEHRAVPVPVRLRDVETELDFGDAARKQFCKEVDPRYAPKGLPIRSGGNSGETTRLSYSLMAWKRRFLRVMRMKKTGTTLSGGLSSRRRSRSCRWSSHHDRIIHWKRRPQPSWSLSR